nr:hypothetical protein [Opitutus terrae]
MNREDASTRPKESGARGEQRGGILSVKDIEEKNRVHALRRETKPVDQHIAKAQAHVVCFAAYNTGLGGFDHRRFDIEGVQCAANPRGDGKGKRAVTAADFGGIADAVVHLEAIQYRWYIEKTLPEGLVRHSAIAHFHVRSRPVWLTSTTIKCRCVIEDSK